LVATLPTATDRVVLGVWPDFDAPVTASVTGHGEDTVEKTIDCTGPKWAHGVFELEEPTEVVTVRLAPSGQVTFFGYDA
jgi:hypothetical protein